jgi:LacI family transcriptional regulator
MATIYDVAKLAGVSGATVSHVMNESRFVAEETKQKVLQAMETLRYRRDGVARSLRRSETGTIGLVISDITNPYFADLVRGVEDALYRRGESHGLVLCNTDENADKEKLHTSVLLERRVDGLIVAPAGGNEDYFTDLVSSGVPIVMVDRDQPGLLIDSIVVDNREAAVRLVSHLVGLGHARIAVMQAGLDATSIHDRVAGYGDALAEAGIPFDPALVQTCASDIAAAAALARTMLAMAPRPPAFFCTNNFMTLGLMRAMTELGLRAPEDIALVGFDDFPWAADFRPRLTVAAQPAYAIGQQAIDLLYKRMGNKTDAGHEGHRHVLPADIIIRESCGAKLSAR